jgi:hypothetical protein
MKKHEPKNKLIRCGHCMTPMRRLDLGPDDATPLDAIRIEKPEWVGVYMRECKCWKCPCSGSLHMLNLESAAFCFMCGHAYGACTCVPCPRGCPFHHPPGYVCTTPRTLDDHDFLTDDCIPF